MAKQFPDSGDLPDDLGATASENAALVAASNSAGSSEGNSVNPVSGGDVSPSSTDAAGGEGTSGGGSGSGDFYYPTEIANAGRGEGGINHYIQFESFSLRSETFQSAVSGIKEKLDAGSIESLSDVKELLGKFSRDNGTVERRIAIYMPSQVINKIGINYQTTSFESIDNAVALAAGGFAGMSGEEQISGAAVVASKSGSALINKMISLITEQRITAGRSGTGVFRGAFNQAIAAAGGGVAQEIEAAVSRGTGVAINPRLTSLFKNPELRNFAFTFVFSPRDPSEAAMVNNIINYFKAASLPRSFGAASFLSFPNEFRISCKTGGNDNEYMFKTKRCVISNIEVNHTPSALFNAFGNGSHYGMPTQSTLSLNFTETEILTSEDITNKVAY